MSAPVFQRDARQRSDGLWVFSREEFASKRFDYKDGDHVVFGGPTTAGKTTLAFYLLDYVATPTCPAFVAVSKPKDPTTEREGKRLGFRRVDDWPPLKKLSEFRDGPPRGYLVWPKYGDMDTDVDRSYKVTRTLLRERYAAGARDQHGILVMDDTVVKSKILGLDKEMTTILAMASAMGLGQWTFVQKPTDSGRTALWSYGASEHVFLSYDGDRKNQARYDEIGGVDPRMVSGAISTLEPYQFVYIRRTGHHVCIVDSK